VAVADAGIVDGLACSLVGVADTANVAGAVCSRVAVASVDVGDGIRGVDVAGIGVFDDIGVGDD
jgi:hypothetical protein